MKFKTQKNRLIAIAASVVIGMSLAACGPKEEETQAPNVNVEDTTEAVSEAVSAEGEAKADAPAMSKEDYLAEVEKLNTITQDFATAMIEWSNQTAQNQDLEAAIKGIDDMRAITDGYSDFVAITNPAEGFEQAHSELAESVKAYKDDLDVYYDSLVETLNGNVPSDEDTQKMQDNMQKDIEDIGTAMSKIEALK